MNPVLEIKGQGFIHREIFNGSSWQYADEKKIRNQKRG